jgi:hypothetical protein
MISQETRVKANKMAIAASFLFLIATLSTRYLSDDYLAVPTLLFSLTIFFVSGCVYVAAFLAILDDRKDFIEIVKRDFAHIYKKTKIAKKN